MSRKIFAVACAIFLLVTSSSMAQVYPTRPIRLIVAYAPGGGNDIVARLISQKFQELTGQPLVVENKPGGDTIIATSFVAKSEPDGYTVLLTGMGGFTITPALNASLPYDPIKDFVPVSIVAQFPYVLAVSNAMKVTTVEELIANARANPDKVSYGDASPATRLATEMFAKSAGLSLNRVFYRGSGPVAQALVANDVQMTIADATALLELHNSDKARILAVTPAQRVAALPGTPTLSETAALAGYDFAAWIGLFAPAKTPEPIVSTLNSLIARIVVQQDFRDRLRTLTAEAVGSTAEQARVRIHADLSRNAAAARLANMGADQSSK
jgi:tripartite-type tricarboxylate transporter receptor subunit TctC